MDARTTKALEGLEQAIVVAARDAFSAVQQAHRERFYAFVLYTDYDLGFLVPSCNSEEALESEQVRWSPTRWAYHKEGEASFDKARRRLEALWKGVGDDEDARDLLREAIWVVLHSALKLLDADGFFGQGIDRERVVVNILMDDPDLPVHFRSAEELNPRRAFHVYARGNIEGLRASAKDQKSYPGARKLLERVERELAATAI